MNLLNADSREDQLVNVNYGSTELAVTPTKEWQRLDNELESLMAAFAMNPRFHLSKTLDQMDDHVILTLVVQASIMECEGLSTPPSIVFRLHHDLGSLRTETYVFVKENFFSRKGKEVQLRLRYDEAAATSYETSFSTNFSSVFINNGYEPLLKLGVYDRLRLQINTTRGNPVFSIFDIYATRPAFDLFFQNHFWQSFS